MCGKTHFPGLCWLDVKETKTNIPSIRSRALSLLLLYAYAHTHNFLSTTNKHYPILQDSPFFYYVNSASGTNISAFLVEVFQKMLILVPTLG